MGGILGKPPGPSAEQQRLQAEQDAENKKRRKANEKRDKEIRDRQAIGAHSGLNTGLRGRSLIGSDVLGG